MARAHDLSNDEFWSLAAGQWMLAHHAFMGLDPFSYTESHRRWVTDEWGSEIALATLFRAFGAAAYSLYAIVLGGLCLVASAAYARALGARGGRVVAIVLLLALGIAGVVAADRGLDFSLVWLPLELLLLTKARANPRWLFLLPAALPLLGQHARLHPPRPPRARRRARVVADPGALRPAHRRACTSRPTPGHSRSRCWGACVASCITPYGPGLLAYDVGVSRNGQIAQYIVEWNSPNFHSVMTLLVYCVPLAVLVACIWTRRIPLLEGSLGLVLFVEALQTQRLAVYLLVVAAGVAATLPARAGLGGDGPALGGRGLVVIAIVILAIPAVPAGTVASSQPVRAFDYLSAHPGRIFTEYTWGDYSVARHRATFVDGRTDLFEGQVLTEFMAVTNLTTNPDRVLSASHVAYVVWAPRTPLALYLARDPRWHVVDRSSVALVFARR